MIARATLGERISANRIRQNARLAGPKAGTGTTSFTLHSAAKVLLLAPDFAKISKRLGEGVAATTKEMTSMKAAFTAILALGLGLAVPASGNAAAAPPAALDAALAATDGIHQAQLVRQGTVVGGRPVVRAAPRGVVRPGGAVVRPGGVVVRPGFAGRPVGVVGRPGFGRGPAFVRGYRPFYRRPWFGTVVGGIALGTIVTAAVVGTAPAYAPAPGLCWYWADPSLTTGYWDYCTAPAGY
jgi:hypothetical protein